MTFSMTGFASLEREVSGGTLIIELRSVNHRYLELHMKLDDSLRSFEPMARELIAAHLGRGKVECRMSLMRSQDAAKKPSLMSASCSSWPSCQPMYSCTCLPVHR